jgi:hypothetical protein
VESTYVVRPGGQVEDIRLQYNVPVDLTKDGDLRFVFEHGYMSEAAPIACKKLRGSVSRWKFLFALRVPAK